MTRMDGQKPVSPPGVKWQIALVILAAVAFLGLFTVSVLARVVPSEVKLRMESAGLTVSILGGAGLFVLLFKLYFQAFTKLLSLALALLACTYFGLTGALYRTRDEAIAAQRMACCAQRESRDALQLLSQAQMENELLCSCIDGTTGGRAQWRQASAIYGEQGEAFVGAQSEVLQVLAHFHEQNPSEGSTQELTRIRRLLAERPAVPSGTPLPESGLDGGGLPYAAELILRNRALKAQVEKLQEEIMEMSALHDKTDPTTP